MTKAFGAPVIPINGTTSLVFTISNPNTLDPLAGLAFTDTFPSGMVVGPTPGASTTCGGGTVTAVAGAGSVSLSGGTVNQNTTCTVTVTIQGTTDGTQEQPQRHCFIYVCCGADGWDRCGEHPGCQSSFDHEDLWRGHDTAKWRYLAYV